MATKRVIPIRKLGGGPDAAVDAAHSRLERAGYMRMMVLAEPGLSQMAERYRGLGYEVELLPYQPDYGVEEVEWDGDAAAVGAKFGTLYVRKMR